MKSIFKKSMAVTIVVFMLILTAIPFASAATLLDESDESKKVSFKVNCDKPGYTFEVYEVAKQKRFLGIETNRIRKKFTQYFEV